MIMDHITEYNVHKIISRDPLCTRHWSYEPITDFLDLKFQDYNFCKLICRDNIQNDIFRVRVAQAAYDQPLSKFDLIAFIMVNRLILMHWTKFKSMWNNSYRIYISPKDLRIAATTHTMQKDGVEAA